MVIKERESDFWFRALQGNRGCWLKDLRDLGWSTAEAEAEAKVLKFWSSAVHLVIEGSSFPLVYKLQLQLQPEDDDDDDDGAQRITQKRNTA